MTDAEFVIWAKREAPGRRVLVEIDFAYESGGTMHTGTVYFADGPYATGHDEAPPSTIYRAAVASIADVENAIDANTLSGLTDVSMGNIDLDNDDGDLDYLLRLIVDGRAARIYVGDVSWQRRDFRLIGTVVSRRFVGAGEKRITLEAADGVGIVDASIFGAVADSVPEAGKFEPLIFGSVHNLSPVLLDATALTYQVIGNYGSGTFVAEVRDKGGSLGNIGDIPLFSGDNSAVTANAGTDKINFVGHGLSDNQVVLVASTGTVFAGLTANTRYWVVGVVGDDFGLSLTRGGSLIDITGTAFSGTMSFQRFKYMDTTAVDGRIQLSTDPVGQITCDVQSDSGAEAAPFDLARRLILGYSGITSDEIDAASFTQADTNLVARLDNKYATIGIAVTDRANLTNILSELLTPLGGWYGLDYDGVFRAGLVDPYNLQSQVHARTVARSQIDDGYTIENLPIFFGGASINASRNWTVQADGLLDSLTESGRALFRRQFRERFNDGNGFLPPSLTYLPFWWQSHKTAIPVDRDSFLSSYLNLVPLPRADTEIAREQVEDSTPLHQLLTVTIGLEAFDWRLGEVVRVTLPRFGFSAGWNFRIIRRRLDVMRGRLTFGLITQVTPDYTSASHP